MWSSGDNVLLRYVRFDAVRGAFPHVVAADDGDLVVLHLPVGAVCKRPVWDGRPIRGQADRAWELYDHPWHSGRVLHLMRPGLAHSIDLFWDEADAFRGWYVNLQEPLRRTALGFDTDDLVLDIWVEPDGSWWWKDEDELDEAVRLGRFTPAAAKAIREEGVRVVAEWPFPTGWEDWRPDPAWPMPLLPQGWDVV